MPPRASRAASGAAFSGAFLAVSFVSGPAAAGDFDAAGVFAPDKNAVFVESFEVAPPQAEGEAPATVTDDETALLGQRVLEVGTFGQAAAYVKFPDGRGSYRARAWIKGEGVVSVSVEYLDRSPFAFTQLYPTGRVTSDDWVELASAPFSVDSDRGPQAGVGVFSPQGARLDAVEIVRDGDFRDLRTCKGDADKASCRADEICVWRACRDARGFFPPVPEDQTARLSLARYMETRIGYFFGPWQNRRRYLPEANAELGIMRATKSNVLFWGAFGAAIRRLHDSHSTSTPAFAFIGSRTPTVGRKSLNACFIVGDGDLSGDRFARDAELPDVLVGHAGKKSAWGLKAGDRLVAVDGVHPLRWEKGLVKTSWSLSIPDDVESVSQIAEVLRGDVSRFAETVSVVRCNAATGICGGVETFGVAQQADEDPDTDWVHCDHRPLGHLAGYPVDHGVFDSVLSGLVLDQKPGERIYGLIWDSLLGGPGGVTKQIAAAASLWKQESARGIILDHRTGNGGTADAPEPILDFTTPEAKITALAWRSRVDEVGPTSLEEGLALAAKLGKAKFSVDQVGSKTPTVTVPVALMVTRDVSQSDYFPHQLKGSPNARIFGPHPTNGAFSSLNGLSYWVGLSFQLASGDTVDVRTGQALCGSGAIPDEIVLPKQSDLLKGKDTVYEAAAAWVRKNLASEVVK